MIVPCMVNSWLYCSTERNCRPGWASSARISSAISPPIRKKANDVIRYRIPRSLGSVVFSIRPTNEPGFDSRAGYGVVEIGFGATAVTDASCPRVPPLAAAPRSGTALVDPAIVTARGPGGSPGERIHDDPSYDRRAEPRPARRRRRRPADRTVGGPRTSAGGAEGTRTPDPHTA